MRLGGAILEKYDTPSEWLKNVKENGYSCVTAPVDETASEEEIRDYICCVKENDLVIGEVGIWKNAISPYEDERKAAVALSIKRLELAEKLGANCCVNVSGSRGDLWYGLHRDNFLPATYDLVVETVREIIDRVKPERTSFSLEPMPWMIPDSPEQYAKLIKDVDRKAFGVHLDFVNMINSPEKYAYHQDFIASCLKILGERIKSIHLKDIRQVQGIPYSFAVEECPPGEGIIDFRPILKQCERLGPDTTVFVEHMERQEQYRDKIIYLRKLADEAGVVAK